MATRTAVAVCLRRASLLCSLGVPVRVARPRVYTLYRRVPGGEGNEKVKRFVTMYERGSGLYGYAPSAFSQVLAIRCGVRAGRPVQPIIKPR